MTRESDARSWTVWIVIGAGLVLALARFVRYIDVVTDNDVAFDASLAWWSMFVAGLGLVVHGLVDQLSDRAPTDPTRAWVGLLVGLLILTLMPASPAPGAELREAFGGMFG